MLGIHHCRTVGAAGLPQWGCLSAGGSCAAQRDVEIWQGGCMRLLSCPDKTEPEGEECEPSLWKVSV